MMKSIKNKFKLGVSNELIMIGKTSKIENKTEINFSELLPPDIDSYQHDNNRIIDNTDPPAIQIRLTYKHHPEFLSIDTYLSPKTCLVLRKAKIDWSNKRNILFFKNFFHDVHEGSVYNCDYQLYHRGKRFIFKNLTEKWEISCKFR
jgi:hypothetical protein